MTTNSYPSEFEEFWINYPRKIEKKNAYITWKRLTKKQKEEVIRAAVNYAVAMRLEKREIQYIKHPKTFLNPKKEVWKDYLTPPKKEAVKTSWAEKYKQQQKED